MEGRLQNIFKITFIIIISTFLQIVSGINLCGMLVSQMGEFFSPTCQIDGEREPKESWTTNLEEVTFKTLLQSSMCAHIFFTEIYGRTSHKVRCQSAQN